MLKPLGFAKPEHLKSRKAIDALFAGGKSLAVPPLRVKYKWTTAVAGVPPVKAGVSVSKRSFKRAVDRNRIKRLLREAYRLQKADLLQTVADKNLHGHLFFMYTDKTILSFQQIAAAMQLLLRQLQQKANAYENIQ